MTTPTAMSYCQKHCTTPALEDAARVVRKDLTLAMEEIKKARLQVGGPQPGGMIELGCIAFTLLPALHALLAYQDEHNTSVGLLSR